MAYDQGVLYPFLTHMNPAAAWWKCCDRSSSFMLSLAANIDTHKGGEHGILMRTVHVDRCRFRRRRVVSGWEARKGGKTRPGIT